MNYEAIGLPIHVLSFFGMVHFTTSLLFPASNAKCSTQHDMVKVVSMSGFLSKEVTVQSMLHFFFLCALFLFPC